MADAEIAKPGEDDGALLAVEATEPVILQEPDRMAEAVDPPASAPLAQKPAKRKNGVLGYVIGAAVLAGAGFGAAKYGFPDTKSADAIAALQTQFDANLTEDAALRSDLAKLAARPAPDATLTDRIATLEASTADATAINTRLTTLEDRLAAIETASVGGEGAPAAALAAMDRELKGLKAAVAAQEGSATADLAAVTAAAEAAAKQAALSHIRAAFESGAPLGPALDSLKAMGADIPATLANAGEGVPSLLTLQEGFAEPARAALDASIRADMGEGWANRLTSFLRSQSGARSLTPHEGTDPDAVLSRAEAALQDGQIKAALAELAGLPPAGAEAMKPWIADATRRIDTDQAISDLSATLNGQ